MEVGSTYNYYNSAAQVHRGAGGGGQQSAGTAAYPISYQQYDRKMSPGVGPVTYSGGGAYNGGQYSGRAGMQAYGGTVSGATAGQPYNMIPIPSYNPPGQQGYTGATNQVYAGATNQATNQAYSGILGQLAPGQSYGGTTIQSYGTLGQPSSYNGATGGQAYTGTTGQAYNGTPDQRYSSGGNVNHEIYGNDTNMCGKTDYAEQERCNTIGVHEKTAFPGSQQKSYERLTGPVAGNYNGPAAININERPLGSNNTTGKHNDFACNNYEWLVGGKNSKYDRPVENYSRSHYNNDCFERSAVGNQGGNQYREKISSSFGGQPNTTIAEKCENYSRGEMRRNNDYRSRRNNDFRNAKPCSDDVAMCVDKLKKLLSEYDTTHGTSVLGELLTQLKPEHANSQQADGNASENLQQERLAEADVHLEKLVNAAMLLGIQSTPATSGPALVPGSGLNFVSSADLNILYDVLIELYENGIYPYEAVLRERITEKRSSDHPLVEHFLEVYDTFPEYKIVTKDGQKAVLFKRAFKGFKGFSRTGGNTVSKVSSEVSSEETVVPTVLPTTSNPASEAVPAEAEHEQKKVFAKWTEKRKEQDFKTPNKEKTLSRVSTGPSSLSSEN